MSLLGVEDIQWVFYRQDAWQKTLIGLLKSGDLPWAFWRQKTLHGSAKSKRSPHCSFRGKRPVMGFLEVEDPPQVFQRWKTFNESSGKRRPHMSVVDIEDPPWLFDRQNTLQKTLHGTLMGGEPYMGLLFSLLFLLYAKDLFSLMNIKSPSFPSPFPFSFRGKLSFLFVCCPPIVVG